MTCFSFSDEAYREFCYDGANTFFSHESRKGVENNVILLDSVSKRYSECGVRIGALITRNKEVISTALKFGQARLSPPGLGPDCCRSLYRYTCQTILRKSMTSILPEEIIW